MSSLLPDAPRIGNRTVRCFYPKAVAGANPLKMRPGGKETLLGYLGPTVRVASGRIDRALDWILRRDVLTPEKIGVDLEANTIMPDHFAQAVADHPEILSGLKERSGEERTPENLTTAVFCRVLERETATTFDPYYVLERYPIGSPERTALWETILNGQLPESAEGQVAAVAEALRRYYPNVISRIDFSDREDDLKFQVVLVKLAAEELPISHPEGRNGFMLAVAERLYSEDPLSLGKFIVGTIGPAHAIDYIKAYITRKLYFISEQATEDYLAAFISSAALGAGPFTNILGSLPEWEINDQRGFVYAATRDVLSGGPWLLDFPASPTLIGKIAIHLARGNDQVIAKLLVDLSSLFFPMLDVLPLTAFMPYEVGPAFAGPNYGVNPLVRAGEARRERVERNEADVARKRAHFINCVLGATFSADRSRQQELLRIVVTESVRCSDINNKHAFKGAFSQG